MLRNISPFPYNPHIKIECMVQENDTTVEKNLRSLLALSYEMLKKAKFQGRILRNGKPAFTNVVCKAGDILQVQIDENTGFPCRALDMDLDIVYEDEQVLILNKPAPLPTVLGLSDTCNTLPNILMHYFGKPGNFLYRPLNRLDSGTSGLMLIAKNAYIQSYLQKKLHTEEYQREYIALVENFCLPEEGFIDLPIARLSANTWGIDACGKPSQTSYQVLEKNTKYALLKVQLHTGRTHQIRLHFSHHGAPVVGDYVYGKEHPLLPKRFALLSHRLRVKLPYKSEVSEFIADIPESFYRIYNEL